MLIPSRKNNKFKERTDHTNYYNKNGDVVPSVTTILKVISKESLIYWANNLGWKRKSVKRELDDSSTIGTFAHNYIEAYITNNNHDKEQILYDIQFLPEEIYDSILKAILSFKKWWSKNKDRCEIIECEKSMSCKHYGGTSDIILKFDGKLMIFDLKTSKDVYFTMFLQLAAYCHLYKITENIMPNNCGILRLDKYDGNEAELTMMSDVNGDIEYYYQCFKQIVKTHYFLHIIENEFKK